jgi:hypothetical protein
MIEALKRDWAGRAALAVAGFLLGWLLHTPDIIEESHSIKEATHSVSSTVEVSEHSAAVSDSNVTAIHARVVHSTPIHAETGTVRGAPRIGSVECPVFDLRTSLVLSDTDGVIFIELDSIACGTQTIARVRLAGWQRPTILYDTTKSQRHSIASSDVKTLDKRQSDSDTLIESDTKTVSQPGPFLILGVSFSIPVLESGIVGFRPAAISPGVFAGLNLGPSSRGLRPLSITLEPHIDPSRFSVQRPLDAALVDLRGRYLLWMW